MKRIPGYNDLRPFGYDEPERENKVFFWILILTIFGVLCYIASFYL